MRDFEWDDAIWAVVSEDGTFVGVPCLSYEEAKELANQHENSHIYAMDCWGGHSLTWVLFPLRKQRARAVGDLHKRK